MEKTARQLKQMLVDGEISVDQYSQILIENLGEKNFINAFEESLREAYSNCLLERDISPTMHSLFVSENRKEKNE